MFPNSDQLLLPNWTQILFLSPWVKQFWGLVHFHAAPYILNLFSTTPPIMLRFTGKGDKKRMKHKKLCFEASSYTMHLSLVKVFLAIVHCIIQSQCLTSQWKLSKLCWYFYKVFFFPEFLLWRSNGHTTFFPSLHRSSINCSCKELHFTSTDIYIALKDTKVWTCGCGSRVCFGGSEGAQRCQMHLLSASSLKKNNLACKCLVGAYNHLHIY
jgi:hypothetical protein